MRRFSRRLFALGSAGAGLPRRGCRNASIATSRIGSYTRASCHPFGSSPGRSLGPSARRRRDARDRWPVQPAPGPGRAVMWPRPTRVRTRVHAMAARRVAGQGSARQEILKDPRSRNVMYSSTSGRQSASATRSSPYSAPTLLAHSEPTATAMRAGRSSHGASASAL